MLCAICNESNNPLIKVTEKGLPSLLEFSKKRNEDCIYESLTKSKKENIQVFVHESCRKRFTDKRKLPTNKQERDSRKSTCSFNIAF